MHSINHFASVGAPRAAVFLDRDGTLIEDVGILRSAEQIRLYPDTIDALKKLQENYLLFVITNQSAVATGELTLEQVETVNGALNCILSNAGVAIQQWYVCPHQRRDGCSCIKPKPAFVLKALSDYALDLSRSFVIGDHPHDTYTANELGVFGLYVLTGHGARHVSELSLDKLVFHRISDAAEWLLAHPDHEQALSRQIARAASEIAGGGVAAFPTETVYGLGADVFQPDAVEQIFTIKGRPHFNPLIAHISNYQQLERLVTDFPEPAQRLADAFWPGPLTLVLPKRKEVPDIVTGGLPTVAVRMSAHRIADTLIRQCDTPLAAPSANRFTCTSPTTARHVKEQLGDKCTVIIDGGACRVGVESTVISCTGAVPVVLRPGGVATEEIRRHIGKIEVYCESDNRGPQTGSPGMLPNHYAPATKLRAFVMIPPSYANQADIGLLLFKPSKTVYSGVVEVLSKSGNPAEAATNFFAALRRLDALGLREIVAEYAPDEGIGNAMNDRLSKAALGRKAYDD